MSTLIRSLSKPIPLSNIGGDCPYVTAHIQVRFSREVHDIALVIEPQLYLRLGLRSHRLTRSRGVAISEPVREGRCGSVETCLVLSLSLALKSTSALAGYGHLSPATTGGKAVSIVYAIIGIPIFLIVLADYGKLFTRGLKFLMAVAYRLYNTKSCTRVRRTAPVEVRRRPRLRQRRYWAAGGKPTSMVPGLTFWEQVFRSSYLANIFCFPLDSASISLEH